MMPSLESRLEKLEQEQTARSGIVVADLRHVTDPEEAAAVIEDAHVMAGSTRWVVILKYEDWSSGNQTP